MFLTFFYFFCLRVQLFCETPVSICQTYCHFYSQVQNKSYGTSNFTYNGPNTRKSDQYRRREKSYHENGLTSSLINETIETCSFRFTYNHVALKASREKTFFG